jgi:hypothetical protein
MLVDETLQASRAGGQQHALLFSMMSQRFEIFLEELVEPLESQWQSCRMVFRKASERRVESEQLVVVSFFRQLNGTAKARFQSKEVEREVGRGGAI